MLFAVKRTHSLSRAVMTVKSQPNIIHSISQMIQSVVMNTKTTKKKRYVAKTKSITKNIVLKWNEKKNLSNVVTECSYICWCQTKPIWCIGAKRYRSTVQLDSWSRRSSCRWIFIVWSLSTKSFVEMWRRRTGRDNVATRCWYTRYRLLSVLHTSIFGMENKRIGLLRWQQSIE